jgi:hypothetical protein
MYPLDYELPCILIDLDGTLFDNRHRAHLIPGREKWGNPESWAAYEAAAVNDTVSEPVLELVTQMHRAGFVNLVFCTARFSCYYRESMAQLHTISLLARSRSDLFMRNVRTEGPQLTPGEFKAGVVQSLREQGLKVLWAIDDSPSVIQALEEVGVRTMQVRSLCGAAEIETAGESESLAEEKFAHTRTREKMGRLLERNTIIQAENERMINELQAYRGDGSAVMAAADTYYHLRNILKLSNHVSLVDHIVSMKYALADKKTTIQEDDLNV